MNNTSVAQGGRGSATGPVIGALVILAIIVLSGWYFWNNRTDTGAMEVDKALQSINTQSETDDTASIEADLDATDIENLDSELNAS